MVPRKYAATAMNKVGIMVMQRMIKKLFLYIFLPIKRWLNMFPPPRVDVNDSIIIYIRIFFNIKFLPFRNRAKPAPPDSSKNRGARFYLSMISAQPEDALHNKVDWTSHP